MLSFQHFFGQWRIKRQGSMSYTFNFLTFFMNYVCVFLAIAAKPNILWGQKKKKKKKIQIGSLLCFVVCINKKITYNKECFYIPEWQTDLDSLTPIKILLKNVNSFFFFFWWKSKTMIKMLRNLRNLPWKFTRCGLPQTEHKGNFKTAQFFSAVLCF